MRRLIALFAAAALLAPSPSLAAELELSLKPVDSAAVSVSAAGLQTRPLALALSLNAPASLAMPAVALPASIPVAAPQAQARPLAAKAQAETLSAAVAKTENAAPALDRSFDNVRVKTSGSGSVLGKISAAVTTLAAFTYSLPARAWVDGPPMYLQDHPIIQAANGAAAHPAVQSAAQSPAWLPYAVIGGVVAPIAGLVWAMRRSDKKREESYAALSMAPGMAGVFRPRNDKEKEDDEKKFPGGRDAAGVPITFSSIAGQDEAVAELRKVLHFIKNRQKYQELNPRVEGQKGILFYGPPGTGKTFLAQALANESGMHFVHMNGADFINKYVGTGPAAVRELFQEARGKGGPAIIFIDEIEAILKKRTGNDNNKEEDKTVNAVLAELDGFKKDPNILVIGATNLPEQIDPAALRGGRFALQIPVGLPDVDGRRDIFKKYLEGMKLADGIDAETLAKQTPGVSGADIKYIVNRASIEAGFTGEEAVTMSRFLEAVDERAAGLKRKIVMTPEEKRILAYHEGGHAIMSHVLPDADPVRKVTVVAAGLGALGYMQAMPEQERTMYSREWLIARMAVAFGGRVGEELASGRKFTGASNDIEQASSIARAMVMQYGMSDGVGPIAFDPLFQPGKAGTARSEAMNRRIDGEVKRLIDQAYDLAKRTLLVHKEELDALAKELQEKETLRGPDLERLIPAPKNPS